MVPQQYRLGRYSAHAKAEALQLLADVRLSYRCGVPWIRGTSGWIKAEHPRDFARIEGYEPLSGSADWRRCAADRPTKLDTGVVPRSAGTVNRRVEDRFRVLIQPGIPSALQESQERSANRCSAQEKPRLTTSFLEQARAAFACFGTLAFVALQHAQPAQEMRG